MIASVTFWRFRKKSYFWRLFPAVICSSSFREFCVRAIGLPVEIKQSLESGNMRRQLEKSVKNRTSLAPPIAVQINGPGPIFSAKFVLSIPSGSRMCAPLQPRKKKTIQSI